MLPNLDLERDALRDLMHAWKALSEGDIGTIVLLIQRPGGSVLTVDGTPHARVWQELVRLGFAEMLYSPVDPELVRFASLSFRLTPLGILHLPRVLIQFGMLDCRPPSFAERHRARRTAEPPKRRLVLREKGIFLACTVAVAIALAALGTGPIPPLVMLGIVGGITLLERMDDR